MRFYRDALMRIEAEALAGYAARSSQTRGRVYPEEESLYRTPFQKDRDRVIHTTAFRRLEYKTQVFVNYEGDYYRTRLTHTLEVAQLARSLARALGLNEDLSETVALAHDLGHPPFGHAGERTLAELMEDHGGFDHNKQSLRIVNYLERRYASFRGLNLTFETLEGMMKHETAYDLPCVGEFGGADLRPTLEAQIVNLADEIAYNAHDLDDGLRSGLLHPASLVEVQLVRELAGELGFELPRLSEFERRVLVREMLGLIVNDVIEATQQAITDAEVYTLDDVRKQPQPLASYSPALSEALLELKAFLAERLYQNYHIVRQVGKAKNTLTKLFESYIEMPATLPSAVQQATDKDGLYRAACDYLAGMTDRFALEEYVRLFDPFSR